MKYIILLAIILFSISSLAQECKEASLLQKTETWKAGMKGSEGGTAAELAKEKKVVAAIHTMVKSKYTPMGLCWFCPQ